MLKKFLFVAFVFCAILLGAGYLVYINRYVIIDKIVAYAMDNLTLDTLTNSNTNSDWKTALMQDTLQSLQKKLNNPAGKHPSDSQTTGKNDGLATIADMLANAANVDADSSGQMAQILLRSMGSSTLDNAGFNKATESHDINARDAKGRTLLMNVCRVDVSPLVVKMILQYGASINAVDNKGRSALMYAVALNKNPEVVLSLLKFGADTTIIDNEGKSVFDYTTDDKIIQLLQNNRQ